MAQKANPSSQLLHDDHKFVSVIVIRTDEQRFLAEPLDPAQERYRQSLGLLEAVFTNPYGNVSPKGEIRIHPRGGAGGHHISTPPQQTVPLRRVGSGHHGIPLSAGTTRPAASNSSARITPENMTHSDPFEPTMRP
jgi:hypothetical protein